jgi:hypothetical protein
MATRRWMGTPDSDGTELSVDDVCAAAIVVTSSAHDVATARKVLFLTRSPRGFLLNVRGPALRDKVARRRLSVYPMSSRVQLIVRRSLRAGWSVMSWRG